MTDVNTHPTPSVTPTNPAVYVPQRPWRSETVDLPGVRYHLTHWGAQDSALPPLVLAHGWMDVGASWQFVVDALGADFVASRRIVALDWRGFGQSRLQAPCTHYLFADYLADLDQLLDHLSPDQPVDLVGHSMGGNVVMTYAGVRPERIRRLINLEGFGLPVTQPDQAPGRYARWLHEMRQLRQGQLALKPYPSLQAVAERLRKTNPRLPQDKAVWLAGHWAEEGGDGQWRILGDDAHKVTSAQLYRADEMLEVYAAITAPTLVVEAEDDSLQGWWKGAYTREEFHQRLARVRAHRITILPDAGHMLHHDQPEAVAALIQEFCAE